MMEDDDDHNPSTSTPKHTSSIGGMLFFGTSKKISSKKKTASITSPAAAADVAVTTPSAAAIMDVESTNDTINVEDKAEKAYEAITATLESWTSPKLTQQQQQRSMIDDPRMSNEEWWNSQIAQTGSNDNRTTTPSAASTPLTSTKTSSSSTTTTTGGSKNNNNGVVERAATPVMSNSSKKKITKTSSLDHSASFSPMMMSGKKLEPVKDIDSSMEESESAGADAINASGRAEDDLLPVNVQSPWMKQQQQSPLQQQNSPRQQTQPHKANEQQQQLQHQQSYPRRYHNRHHSPYHWSGLQTTSPRAIAPFKNQSYEYRRYHDALLVYVKARKNLNDRIRLDQQERELSSNAITNNSSMEDDTKNTIFPTFSGDRNLTEEETRVDLDFLWALNSLCWERSDSEHHHAYRKYSVSHSKAGSKLYHHPHCSRREGDFWLLLCNLRRLGLQCLIWSDDDNSKQQNKFEIITYIQNQAKHNVHSSPLRLIEELSSQDDDNVTATKAITAGETTAPGTTTTCPLVLKRRKRILGWMEHCFEQLLPEPARNAILASKEDNTRDTNYKYVAGLTTSKKSLQELNINDKLLMKSCLALVLAGRLDDARQMARRCGQAWRAASWGGGTPSGIKQVPNDEKQIMEQVQIGNVHRSLWKRQMYKLSDKLHERLQQQQDSSMIGQEGSDVANAEAAADEAAIHALLANDYKNAMSNPSLRSWEKGLYSIYSGMWGRLEDELLYLHNKHRREYRPPFPGTQYERQELEQLHATDELLHMTEERVLELLSISPFDEISNDNSLCGAISAFLMGGIAVTEYLSEEHKYFGENTYIEDHQVSHLRFITHLVLYLDSLSVCTTPIVFDESVIAFKNHVLYVYVHHLADHEDLRHMMPLYASLLPTDMLLECFPKLLIQVDNNDERKQILQQIRDLITTSTVTSNDQEPQQEVPLDIIILRKVIRYILSEPDHSGCHEDHQSPLASSPTRQQQQMVVAEETITATTIIDTSGISSSSNITPSLSDIRKMKAIKWLCFYDEHMGDALIASNSLLRQFLLSTKIQSAILFVQDFLPDEIPEKALNRSASSTVENNKSKESSMLSSIEMDVDDTGDEDTGVIRNNSSGSFSNRSGARFHDYYNSPQQQLLIDYARSEHIAYQSYINAFRAVELWSEILTGTPATFDVSSDKLDIDAFNEIESAIASSMERRDLIRQKRKASQIIIENADIAKRDLMAVLTHPGGWLLTDDEEENHVQMMVDNEDVEQKEDESRRIEEIRILRSKFLPHIVTMYQRVCVETSEWMSKSLDDVIPDLGKTSLEILMQLDDFTIDNDQDADGSLLLSLSPLSPKYWIKEALDLAECIVTDTYGIRQAFNVEQLKELFLRMSELKLTELMYN